jgi:P2 family phage contractile tail tube protein
VAVEGVEIAMRGFAKEAGVGTFEQNKPTEGKYTLSLSYMSITAAGSELVLYDAQNNILVVDGADQHAALRAAMGS